ncbi:Hypothetical protein CINCED_3A011513 [Cinara cedri]|uniref:Uncharacterized protein n=1 Tax=Cinara cedri TaxID=506608 RepID=A0A5E4NLP5_9HEMI|nr:Hypothetical protein CINCED_3A011513 [Cinara cedri]
MECSTTRIAVFLLWCCYYNYGVYAIEKLFQRNDVERKIEILETIVNNEIWWKLICNRNILFDGELVNMKDVWRRLLKCRTAVVNVSERNSTESNVTVFKDLLRVSKSIYTALECEYSNVIVDTLKLLFYVGDYFLYLKDHLAKMIYNLFSFRDLYPSLKHADNTFLLSLVSVYLGVQMNTPEPRKTVVARMINLIERFRCKYCEISDYDYYHYESEFEDAAKTSVFEELQDRLERLSEEIDFGMLQQSNGKPTFVSEMYDPNVIMMSHVFAIYPAIEKLTVKWFGNKPVALYDVAKCVIGRSQIRDVYRYYMLFVGMIKDFFCLRFHRVKNNRSMFESELDAFDVYLRRIVPANYPPHLLRSVKKIRRSVWGDLDAAKMKKATSTSIRKITLFKTSRTDYGGDAPVRLSRETIDLCARDTVIVDDDVSKAFIEETEMSEFVQTVIGNEPIFVSTVIEMFHLFSSEPNTLEYHHIFKTDSRRKNEVKLECPQMPKIRETLFLVRSSIAAMHQSEHHVKKTNGPHLSTLLSIKLLVRNLVLVLENFNDHDESFAEIINIFAPLAIYVKSHRYSSLQCIVLKQYLLLTLNAVEGYELNNCNGYGAPVPYNLDMYKTILDDEHMYVPAGSKIVITPADFDTRYITRRITKITKEVEQLFHVSSTDDDYVDDSLSLVDKLVPNAYFQYYDSEFNLTTVFWDGVEVHVNNVNTSVTRDIIDVGHLIRFQIFKLKLLICNVFRKMLFVTRHASDFSTIIQDDSENTLVASINDVFILFGELSFPLKIGDYVKTIVHEYEEIFQNYDPLMFDENFEENSRKMSDTLEEQLELLKTSEVDDNNILPETDLKSMFHRIHYSLETDLKFTSKILESLMESKIIAVDDLFNLV